MSKDLVIGPVIAHYRKLNGLTQEELAEQVGVSTQAVSKWEQQLSCPDIALLPVLAQLFRISLDELFGLPCPAEIVYELVADLPWEDDGKLRFAVYEGRKLLDQSAYELAAGANSIEVRFRGRAASTARAGWPASPKSPGNG